MKIRLKKKDIQQIKANGGSLMEKVTDLNAASMRRYVYLIIVKDNNWMVGSLHYDLFESEISEEQVVVLDDVCDCVKTVVPQQNGIAVLVNMARLGKYSLMGDDAVIELSKNSAYYKQYITVISDIAITSQLPAKSDILSH